MAPLLLVVDMALKVATGFALGFFARGLTGRAKGKTSKSKSNKPGAGAVKAPIFKPREELKMVLCVNEGLKMGKGKIGAQCAHAAVGVVQKYRNKHEALFKQWEYFGQAKVALKINDDVEMDCLAAKAASLDIPIYIVCDAGRTQIPAGSQTVLAIGPAPKSTIDQVTGHLKLL